MRDFLGQKLPGFDEGRFEPEPDLVNCHRDLRPGLRAQEFGNFGLPHFECHHRQRQSSCLARGITLFIRRERAEIVNESPQIHQFLKSQMIWQRGTKKFRPTLDYLLLAKVEEDRPLEGASPGLIFDHNPLIAHIRYAGVFIEGIETFKVDPCNQGMQSLPVTSREMSCVNQDTLIRLSRAAYVTIKFDLLAE